MPKEGKKATFTHLVGRDFLNISKPLFSDNVYKEYQFEMKEKNFAFFSTPL